MSQAQWQALGFDEHSMLADSIHQIFEQSTASDFHLSSMSQAIDAGTMLVNSIVQDDLDGNPRPLGNAYDIGCYEFELTSNQSHIQAVESGITIYPNPFIDFVLIDGDFTNFDIKVFNSMGQLVTDYSNASAPLLLDLSMLPPGLHFISVSNTNQLSMEVFKILKP